MVKGSQKDWDSDSGWVKGQAVRVEVGKLAAPAEAKAFSRGIESYSANRRAKEKCPPVWMIG
jgi:hypothetical protein